MILNEALSFGVLGKTGRGLTEMHGIDVGEVEILTISMAHSLASVGGLCIGTTQVRYCDGAGWRGWSGIVGIVPSGGIVYLICLVHRLSR